MKLFIKNKLVSIGGSSTVVDEQNNQRYVVKGKFFSITSKKRVFNLNGDLLYRVRNKYWHWSWNRYAFIDDAEGNRVATVKLKFGFNKKFFIQGYKDEISVEGNWIGWKYTIYKNGEAIGRLNRDFTVFKDAFTLDIEKEEETDFLVAVVIGIDNIFDNVKSDND